MGSIAASLEALGVKRLFDVSTVAKRARIQAQVILADKVWERLVLPTPNAPDYGHRQSHRLWYLLESLREAILNAPGRRDSVSFAICAEGNETSPLISLQCIARPGRQVAPNVREKPILTVLVADNQ